MYCLMMYRYATGNGLPAVDESSQLTNEQVSVENGLLTLRFTMPCGSTDSNDVPFEGNRYILLAIGQVISNNLAYHGNTRGQTPRQLQLSCQGK